MIKKTPFVWLYRRLRKVRWRIKCRKKIQEYIDHHSEPKIQFGSGTNVIPGWFNTDLHPWRAPQGELYHLDVTADFPIQSNCFSYAFSEHMIEHLTYEEGVHFLGETLRILRPGGVLRISCPDLATLASLYDRPLSADQEEYIREVVNRFQPDRKIYEPGHVINQLFGLTHVFLYDEKTLSKALRDVGFEQIVRVTPGSSDHDPLNGIDKRSDDYTAFETLVIECQKQ